MELYKDNVCIVVLLLGCVSFNIVLSTQDYETSITRKLQNIALRDDYMQKRQKILSTEQEQRVGGELVLNTKEQHVNDKLLTSKHTEIDNAHYQGKLFGPGSNFLTSKSLYDQSSVFKMIQAMPKGKLI